MKKVLFVATVVGHINAFHIPYLKWFREQGWETHVAAHADTEQESHISCCDVFHEVGFTRTPFTLENIKAYKVLKHLIDDNTFDIIHCHTPTGAALTRLAARQARSSGRTKVIYTAHGFHFYKGAPLLNWLVYYPIEKFLSRYTDVLITINKEDYNLAKNTMHAKKTEYVPGVGIDIGKIKSVSVDRGKKRAELGIPQNAFVLISVGELNKNKNHEVVVKALSMMKENRNIHYVVAGQVISLAYGAKTYKLKFGHTIRHTGNQVHLLGFRTDVIELLKASDCFIFPSLREGLPVALMEAMVCGLPVICSAIRGNCDMVTENINGYHIYHPSDINEICSKMVKMQNNALAIIKNLSNQNIKDSIKFDIVLITKKMREIYGWVMM